MKNLALKRMIFAFLAGAAVSGYYVYQFATSRALAEVDYLQKYVPIEQRALAKAQDVLSKAYATSPEQAIQMVEDGILQKKLNGAVSQ